MHYTYILESIHHPGTRYIGQTSDLRRRLAHHNAGQTRSTARRRPWKLKLYIAFEARAQARHFEQYLKSGSGHAFANRHFWAPPPPRSNRADAS
jgi:putative endonuclease